MRNTRRALTWILTATILILLLTNIGISFQNEPDGFRNLKWGDQPAKNMLFIGKEKYGLKMYRVSNEKLSLGDAKFFIILYAFYGQPKRFMAANLYFRGKKNFELLESICRTKFNKPTKIGFFTFEWHGLIAGIYLTYDLIDDEGSLMIGSTTIVAEYLENMKKKKAKEAEKDW